MILRKFEITKSIEINTDYITQGSNMIPTIVSYRVHFVYLWYHRWSTNISLDKEANLDDLYNLAFKQYVNNIMYSFTDAKVVYTDWFSIGSLLRKLI
jgi:hypothetical protein